MVQAVNDIPISVQLDGNEAIERYLMFLDKGEAPTIAEILACRQAPGIRTEATQVAAQNKDRGGATLADQFAGNENLMQYRISQARKHGYNPKPTDYYDSSRAAYPGDPAAWTGNSQSMGDVKAEIQRRGCGMARGESTVVNPETDVAPVPPKKLNERIVSRIKDQMIREDPGLAHTDQRELSSMIKDKHGNKEKDAVE